MPSHRPSTTTCERLSASGLSSTGFMSTCGSMPHASAWVTWPGRSPALGGDPGVVAHVLGLEGRHPQPAPGVEPAQPRHQQALAHRRSPRPGSSASARLTAGQGSELDPRLGLDPLLGEGVLDPCISVTRSAKSISACGASRPVMTTCCMGGLCAAATRPPRRRRATRSAADR